MTQARMPTDWHPASWQSRPAAQQPTYRDRVHLETVSAQLAQLPPLVTTWEIENLKSQLAAAQRGEAFLLQGGDCAENFDETTSDNVVQKLKILLQMSLVMLVGLKKPIIRVGRMAGQYAKPRSADYETKDGVSLPSYRGDIINRPAFTAVDREPDPTLMLRGYERAALTLNFVRSLIDGGFADLHHPENWDLAFVGESAAAADYHALVQSVSDSLEFFEAITGEPMHRTHRVEFYTSHEGLHLPYEQAQTRFLKHRGRWYNLTTHYPWIGMRTADLAGAHIEYFRGIANPMGVKIGTSVSDEQLQQLVHVLNPNNEPGRLTLITRFGAKHDRGAPATRHQGRARDGCERALGLRPDARQYRDHGRGLQDAPLRQHSRRGAVGVPDPSGAGQPARRRAPRAHGRQRDRMHRRRARDSRNPTSRARTSRKSIRA